MSDPVRLDQEVVDLLGDRPDLLAVADAVAATQRRDRSGLTTRWRALAVAATVAVAVAVAIVAPWHSHGGGVVQRSLAAVGGKPVLHAVIESNAPQMTDVDLKTGKRTPVTQTEEYWFDTPREVLRIKFSVAGRPVSDHVLSPGWPSPRPPQVNDALQLFVTGYRRALALGKAQETGRGSVDGRSVIYVTIPFGTSRERVAIDANSYRPVRIEELEPSTGKPEPVVWHVRTIDTRPRNAADFIASPRPPQFGVHLTPQPPVSVHRAASAAGWTPVWLGESFGGLPLRSVQVQKVTEAHGLPVREKTGVLMSYDSGPARILIEEGRLPGLVNGFSPADPLAAPGHAVVTKPAGFGTQCKAQLRTGGLWVTVRAFNTDACVLVVRALVPIGSPLVNRPFTIPLSPTAGVPGPPSASPKPALCARAWNRYASSGARQSVAHDRPLSALVIGGGAVSISFSFGGKRAVAPLPGCFIVFFLPGGGVLSATGSVVHGTVPAWRGPSAPVQAHGPMSAGNASVAADGTVHLNP